MSALGHFRTFPSGEQIERPAPFTFPIIQQAHNNFARLWSRAVSVNAVNYSVAVD